MMSSSIVTLISINNSVDFVIAINAITNISQIDSSLKYKYLNNVILYNDRVKIITLNQLVIEYRDVFIDTDDTIDISEN